MSDTATKLEWEATCFVADPYVIIGKSGRGSMSYAWGFAGNFDEYELVRETEVLGFAATVAEAQAACQKHADDAAARKRSDEFIEGQSGIPV